MKPLRRLYPVETVELANTLRRAEFVAALGAPTLLIQVPDGDFGDLAQALVASLSAASQPVVPSLGFHTAPEPATRMSSIPPASQSRLEPHYRRVRGRLAAHDHVIVPLRKREEGGKAFSTRISVGRAVNNDIVLRHESTSKFHAWLEVDDVGAFYVSDANSRNGTYVNDARVPARTPTLVPLGAELRFATIRTHMCAADTLWQALRGADE